MRRSQSQQGADSRLTRGRIVAGRVASMFVILCAAHVSRAEPGSTDTLSLPPVRVPVNETVEIGDLRNSLVLDSVLDTTITLQGDRAAVNLSLSEPDLYAKLQTALRSRAKSGCSVVHRTGHGRGAAEFKICHIANPTITFDKQKQSVWLRATARLKAQVNGVASDTSNYDVVAEYHTKVADGVITLSPRSINVNGSPGELDVILRDSMKPIELPIDPCLVGVDLRIEDIHLARDANMLTAVMTTPKEQMVPAFLCIAKRELITASGR